MPDWQSTLETNLAADGDEPSSRQVQLATVGLDGAPSVRTVIYRGRFEDALLFTSDTRAAKLRHIAHEPRVELVWYFAATREQLRVAGKMEAVVGDTPDANKRARRAAVWKTLSAEVRRGFAGGPPGRPLEAPALVDGSPPADGSPPLTFALLVLWPERVDHVALGSTPHQRTLHARDAAGHWHARAVHP